MTHSTCTSNDVYSTSSFDWQLVDALAPESQDGRGDPSDGPRRPEHHHDSQVSYTLKYQSVLTRNIERSVGRSVNCTQVCSIRGLCMVHVRGISHFHVI